jgi:ribose/xylose/arabinose/galactoside ABC-type transport system permease subunit
MASRLSLSTHTPHPDEPVSDETSTPKPGVKQGKRRTLGSLFAHQESGLVLVILLMGLGLTIFGAINPINPKTLLSLTGDATVMVLDTDRQPQQTGTLPRTEITGFRVTASDGSSTDYQIRDGWWYDSAQKQLRRERTANAFLNKANLVLIVNNASFIAVMAVGMTGVIILAGIDLSVGSIYGLAGIVGAMVLHQMPEGMSLFLSVPLGLAICIAVGGLCGFANGSMTVGLRVHPFVITLGMMAALRGLTLVLPSEIYNRQSISNFPESFVGGFFRADIWGVQPVPILFMLAVALCGWFVLSRTVFGRQIFAIGGNETAAGYAGIPVGKVKILVYTITGALAGLSACLAIGYYGSGETNAGNAYELQVIAATVIGGASLMGGRGTAIGAVLGAIVIQLINNAIIIVKIDQSYNQIVMGAAIIIAVVIDQTKQRLAAKRG